MDTTTMERESNWILTFSQLHRVPLQEEMGAEGRVGNWILTSCQPHLRTSERDRQTETDTHTETDRQTQRQTDTERQTGRD